MNVLWFGAVAALLLGLMQEILSKRREKQKLMQCDTKIKALEEENETLKKRIKQLEEELKKLKE